MTANQAWFTTTGLCVSCGATLTAKGSEVEFRRGVEVRCTCGWFYRLRWKRGWRGGPGGFVQEIIREEKGEALEL